MIEPETSIRRLFVLLCGFEILPKSISTGGRGERFILSEPVSAYLLDTDDGFILLDAGLNPRNIRDPVRCRRYFHDLGMTPPVLRDAHEMERQLAQIGIGFEDIGHVILSHLHYDHCGHLDRLAHARISVQRREYEAAFAAADDPAYIREDFERPGLQWDLRDGDWSPVPGLGLIDTRGHTEGHQAAVVALPRSGTFVLPFDAGDLQENFDEEIVPGSCCDEDAAREAIRRLKDIRDERDGTMLLFHDPVAIQRMRLAPDWYD